MIFQMTNLKGVGAHYRVKLIVVTFNYSKMASIVTIVRLNFMMGSEDMDIAI